MTHICRATETRPTIGAKRFFLLDGLHCIYIFHHFRPRTVPYCRQLRYSFISCLHPRRLNSIRCNKFNNIKLVTKFGDAIMVMRVYYHVIDILWNILYSSNDYYLTTSSCLCVY